MWAFVIGRFLLCLMIGLILVGMTVGCNDVSKFSEGSWQGSFYSKQWKRSSNFKAFVWIKQCFDRIPLRPEFACKFADWFSSVFQLLQVHYCVICNLTDNSSIKTNQVIMIFAAPPKKYRHVSIQVQVFWRKLKKLRIFSCNKKKLKAWTCKRKSFNG